MTSLTYLRTLIVEDNADDVALIVRMLTRGGYGVEDEHVQLRADMQAALFHPWDVILCDYFLPGFEWPGALELALDLQPETPFIVLSGYVDDDRGRAAILAGAADYLDKRYLARLAEMVRYQISLARLMRRNVQQAAAVIGKATGPLGGAAAISAEMR